MTNNRMTVTVTSAELAADLDGWLGRARFEPLSVTRDGEEVAVILPAGTHAWSRDGDGRSTSVGDLSDGEMALIMAAEVPAEHDPCR